MKSSSILSFSPQERRGATRYSVDLRMEVWPESKERLPDPTFVRTRDMSLRGIYFLSDVKHERGARLNFSVIFLREFTREDTDLISGVARIVRCELLSTREPPRFGVALAIEKTVHTHGE